MCRKLSIALVVVFLGGIGAALYFHNARDREVSGTRIIKVRNVAGQRTIINQTSETDGVTDTFTGTGPIGVLERAPLPKMGSPRAENTVAKFDNSFVGEWVANPESKVSMVPSTFILLEDGVVGNYRGGLGRWEFDGESIVITAGPMTEWWKVGKNDKEMTLTHRSIRGGPKAKFGRYASRLLKEDAQGNSEQPPSTGEGEVF